MPTQEEVIDRIERIFSGLDQQLKSSLHHMVVDGGQRAGLVTVVFDGADERANALSGTLGFEPTPLPVEACLIVHCLYGRLMKAAVELGYKHAKKPAHFPGTVSVVVFTLGLMVIERIDVIRHQGSA